MSNYEKKRFAQHIFGSITTAIALFLLFTLFAWTAEQSQSSGEQHTYLPDWVDFTTVSGLIVAGVLSLGIALWLD